MSPMVHHLDVRLFLNIATNTMISKMHFAVVKRALQLIMRDVDNIGTNSEKRKAENVKVHHLDVRLFLNIATNTMISKMHFAVVKRALQLIMRDVDNIGTNSEKRKAENV